MTAYNKKSRADGPQVGCDQGFHFATLGLAHICVLVLPHPGVPCGYKMTACSNSGNMLSHMHLRRENLSSNQEPIIIFRRYSISG